MQGKLVATALASGIAVGAYKLYSHVRKPRPFVRDYSEAPKKVLVVGGGFGGLAALEELAQTFGGSEEVGAALIDPTE